MWDDEYYYMLAYDSEDEKIKHYRVDQMLNIDIVDRKREGQKDFKAFDMPRYTKSLFGMFSGEQTTVTLEGTNDMAGVLIDRFGKDIMLHPIDADHFSAHVEVAISKQFLGWVIALGEDIKITAPQAVVEQMQEETKRLCRQYL